MHHPLLEEEHQTFITALYAHLQAPTPPATTRSDALLDSAEKMVRRVAATAIPVDPDPVSPELLTVIEQLHAQLATCRRTDPDVAQLATILYLGYELVREVRHEDHPAEQPG